MKIKELSLILIPFEMKKTVLVILALFCLKSNLFSQNGNTSNWPKEEQIVFESANALYDEKLYPLAYERYKSLLLKHPDETYLKYLLGKCGIFVSDKYTEALAFLDEVLVKNKKAVDINYFMAQLYHRTYQFDKCIEMANKLLANPKIIPGHKTTLEQLINYCSNAKILIQHPVKTDIQNIGKPPNTEAAEYSPVITPDEETLIYTYRGKESSGGLRDIFDKPNDYGFYYEDIFVSHKIDGKWQSPESIGENNTESNDAVIALSNDGQQLFIFRANESDGGDIYVSRLNGTKFEPAEKLRGDINTTNWEGSISLSADQKKVIFASERPGGFGAKDLYSAVKMPDGSWGNVKNLGDKVNTPTDDDAPFLHPDGRTLIFSSKGHNSMGEYDIFLSDMNETDSTWKAPVNIGYPINTTGDDIYYVLSADGKRGYYASARVGGQGDEDIYVIEPAVSREIKLIIIKGKITENTTPYSTDITVNFSNDGRHFATFKSNLSSGNYLVNLPLGSNYKLSFYHPVFGEKIYTIITDKIEGYAEKVLNVNFGTNDTTKYQTIVIEQKTDSISTTPPISGNNSTSQNEKDELKKMEQDAIISKYGDVKVQGLKYVVQVGAYKHPENYRPSKNLQKLGKIKRNGKIANDVTVFIMDKEFATLKEVDAYLKEIRSAGQKDAFMTADYNGKRYYIKDLAEMGVWISPAT